LINIVSGLFSLEVECWSRKYGGLIHAWAEACCASALTDRARRWAGIVRDFLVFTAFSVSFAVAASAAAQVAPSTQAAPPIPPAPTSQTATASQPLAPTETAPMAQTLPSRPPSPETRSVNPSMNPSILSTPIGPTTGTEPSTPRRLPAPTGRPMEIDFSSDPVLRLRRQNATYEQFQEAVAAAVEQHPGIAEAAATEDEALGVVREARSAMRPTVDLNVTGYRVLAREFSNDPTNIIERSRPAQRTDAILSAQQVAAREDHGDRLRLDGGGFGIALLRDGAKQLGDEPEAFEGRAYDSLLINRPAKDFLRHRFRQTNDCCWGIRAGFRPGDSRRGPRIGGGVNRMRRLDHLNPHYTPETPHFPLIF